MLLACAGPAKAQPAAPGPSPESPRAAESRERSIVLFLGGAATGLVAHEAAHLGFDLLFDADPRLKKVDFHGIPFFAITHRPDLSRVRRFTIASAGFWAQHAGSEWILTRRPTLRRERSPFRKGMVAFNVAASAAYAGAAFARTGPLERDTRGIAEAARLDERIVGVFVLAPAALDAWRYFHPDARWAAWLSRAAKVGMVFLILR